MAAGFEQQIAAALGAEAAPDVPLIVTGAGDLPSIFDVAGLAEATFAAAARELGALVGARRVTLDRRLAVKWFEPTLRPMGWSLPPTWDAVAGDYRAGDGWIRLHTNAPHHRRAALDVLGCAETHDAVAQAVADWGRTELEQAVVEAGGAAAAMHTLAEWAAHPQGRAVAAEPLIAWQRHDEADRPAARGLEGVKVLDLTRVLAGPIAARLLAGFGAEVLRIDPPDWNEPAIEPEVTLGKRRAGLDLHKADDRRTFEALLARADLLLHGYRPGALERLGYGAAERRAINPGLSDVTLCAYGWSGPWAARRGFDSLVQMSSGIAAEGMVRSGSAGPRPLPVQALDHGTGYLLAAAALRTLRMRQAQGLVTTARLSLARTAALLVSGGIRPPSPALAAETEADLEAAVEATHWGPARRLAFPVRLDGAAPVWAYPAGPLRVSDPSW